MTTAGLFLSRLRDSAAVLAALAVVVFVAALALGVTLASVQHGVVAGSARVLDSAAPQSAAVRITTHLADDAERQTVAALDMVDRLFPTGTVDVHSASRSLPVDVLGAGVAAVFGVEPALLDDATITSGDWPASGVAVQEDAAAALDLAVGDTFSVGDAADPLPLTVAALWRANDPASPQWFAESAVASGRDGDALGVIVVEPETLRALPTQLFTSWTVTATHDALTDTNRDAVADGLDRLHDSVQATPDVVDVSSSTDGTLAATLDRIADAGRGATAIAASALVIVALLGVVALVQLCAVLVGSRRQQTDLARARGLSLPQLTVLSIGEALVVAVPASLLGALAAVLVSGARTGDAFVAPALTAAAMTAATVGCFVAVVLVDVRPTARAAGATRSPAAFLVGGSVIAAAAALATWQLYNRGDVAGVDLVAATSPALTLVAASVLGTALLYPVGAGIAHSVTRSGRIGSVLAARQISRQVTRYLVPSLALAIAVASAVFATGLATTWSGTERAVRFGTTGSDVSVALSTDGTAAITSAPFAALDGSDAAAALVLANVGLGSDRLPFVALSPRSAERVLGTQGAVAAAALAQTTPDDTRLELPAGATGISATVEFAGDGSAPTSSFDVGVWAADADGSLSRVALTPVAAPTDVAGPSDLSGPTDWAGPLPEGVAPFTLLAVETLRTGKADPAASAVEVSNLAGSTGAPVSIGLTASSPRSITPVVDDGAPLPDVVTTALAARYGLAVGDPLSFDFEPTGKSIDAIVAAITARLPGVASKLALGTDLAALDAVTLRQGSAPAEANEVWISTGDPTAVAAAVARTTTNTAVVASPASTSSQPILGAALTAFWLAAAAAALLALVAVGAFFTDDFRGRRGDIAVLRALGFSPRDQGATRGREQLIVTVFSLLVGAAAGAAATALTVGPFIAATVPAAAVFVSIAPAFDPLPWLGFCAVLVLFALAMFAVLLASVRREAAAAVEGGSA